jgi:hypothetical protein
MVYWRERWSLGHLKAINRGEKCSVLERKEIAGRWIKLFDEELHNLRSY